MNTLDNVDFLIPVYIDHPDRLRNLEITLKYLEAIGAKNVFVNEHYMGEPKVIGRSSDFYACKDITDAEYYNKMACGNEAFKIFSTNDIVCLYDVDVLAVKADLVEATNKLLNSGYDFAYPFNGQFYDIPVTVVKRLQENLRTNINLEQCTLFAPQSHGGCVMFKRDTFIDGGRFNPNFKNVGFDDDEINVRFLRLGYKKYRTSSPLVHLNHHRGKTSYNHNKYNEHNGSIVRKVSTLPVEELKQYIRTWEHA